ncbi:MAG: hypothetical protein GWN79_21530, partial [Actinobacteria bacterium]|nr:hypothetical protein [Actinomycetota bacterium]NIU21489.1 hypothetical protein [Actinomycetota bacterium]
MELPRGDYLLYAVTDGSHDHGSWNAATPFEPEAWGVRVWTGPDLDAGDLTRLDRAQLADDGRVLAEVVRVGDDARERARFTLDEEMRVQIYAIGEGQGGRM